MLSVKTTQETVRISRSWYTTRRLAAWNDPHDRMWHEEHEGQITLLKCQQCPYLSYKLEAQRTLDVWQNAGLSLVTKRKKEGRHGRKHWHRSLLQMDP